MWHMQQPQEGMEGLFNENEEEMSVSGERVEVSVCVFLGLLSPTGIK